MRRLMPMNRNVLIAGAAIALFSTPTLAAKPCRAANGHFVKCGTVAATTTTTTGMMKTGTMKTGTMKTGMMKTGATAPGPMSSTKTAPTMTKTTTKTVRCRANNKFAKCGTPGAKPM